MAYLQELDALQRWIFATAALGSLRLSVAPPKIARPMILWEAPARSKDRNISRWQYVNKVTQFGTLFAADLEQLLDYQDRLQMDLEAKVGQLDVYNQEGAAGVKVGKLQQIQLFFDSGANNLSLDVPLRIQYEATYSRTRIIAPAPTTVTTRIVPKGITK